MSDQFAHAQRQLFDSYGTSFESRMLTLADPALDIGVCETGTGPPVLFVHGTFFRILTTPGLGRLISRAPVPKSAAATRKASAKSMGQPALARTPDEFFEVVRAGWR